MIKWYLLPALVILCAAPINAADEEPEAPTSPVTPPPATQPTKWCDIVYSTDQNGDFSDGIVVALDETGKIMLRVRDINIRIPTKGRPMAKLVSFDGLFAPDSGPGVEVEYRRVRQIRYADAAGFRSIINGNAPATAAANPVNPPAKAKSAPDLLSPSKQR